MDFFEIKSDSRKSRKMLSKMPAMLSVNRVVTTVLLHNCDEEW